MTNLLQDGVAWLAQQMQHAAGRAVTYKRGSMRANVTAIPSTHEYEIVDEEGIATTVTVYDYTIVATDLVLGGVRREPRSGDQIVETVNGVDCAFSVLPLGNRPCFEWKDRSAHHMLNIHTKRVG